MWDPRSKCAFVDGTPYAAGLSTLLFLVPAAAHWQRVPWLAAVLVVQSAVAFASDFVMTGRTSHFHPLDRLLARSVFVLVVLATADRVGLAKTACLVAPCAAAYLGSAHAIRRRDPVGYAAWHTTWHCVAAATLIRVGFFLR